MLYLKVYQKIIGILVLGYCFFLSYPAQAQCYLTATDIKIEKETYGEQLHRLGVDTTQIDSIYQALEEETLLKSQYAALFLAEQNRQDATELIKSKYSKERKYARGAFRYLKALKMLEYKSTETMLVSFADSLYQVVRADNANDTEHHVYQNTVDLLLEFSNESQFSRIIEIIKSQANAEDTKGYLSLLIKFLDIEKFEDEIIDSLIFILKNYSYFSPRAQVANLSCLFPDSKQLQQALREAAIEDSSYDVRKWSLIRLQETYRDSHIIDLTLKNLETVDNRNQVSLYLLIIKDEFNPKSLFLIKKLKDEGSNDLVMEEAADMYKDYWWLHFEPYGKEFNYSPSQTLDSLEVYSRDIASYDWLGDQGFVKELSNRLDNVQRHLTKGDEKNAAKQIESYRRRVQQVYEQTLAGNKNPRFVTEDGYKFLYYNAGYLLKQLEGPENGGNHE